MNQSVSTRLSPQADDASREVPQVAKVKLPPPIQSNPESERGPSTAASRPAPSTYPTGLPLFEGRIKVIADDGALSLSGAPESSKPSALETSLARWIGAGSEIKSPSHIAEIQIGQTSKFADASSRTYNDRFGNEVEAFYSRNSGVELLGLRIRPCERFSEAPNGAIPIEVDLSRLGAGEKVLIGFQGFSPALDMKGHPPIIPAHVGGKVPEECRQGFGPLRAGCNEAETSLGAEPGSVVKLIAVRESAERRASIPTQHNSALHLTTQILKDSADALRVIGRHETYHAFDFQSNYELSGGKFEKLHTDLAKHNPRFLDQIDETKFYGGKGGVNIEGGHSRKNSWEFCASLMNSVSRPAWEAKVEGQPKSFKKTYLKSLETLKTNFDQACAKGTIPADASFLKLLDSRISSLKKMC